MRHGEPGKVCRAVQVCCLSVVSIRRVCLSPRAEASNRPVIETCPRERAQIRKEKNLARCNRRTLARRERGGGRQSPLAIPVSLALWPFWKLSFARQRGSLLRRPGTISCDPGRGYCK